jgi:murein DD-endopeptidase MepM/ murein hydrolase activator NlpD
LSSPANPGLRALRRLVARDPDAPLRFDFTGTVESVACAARWVVRAVAAPSAELVGWGASFGLARPGEVAETAAEAAGSSTGEPEAGPSAAAGSKAGRSNLHRLSGAFGGPVSWLSRHHRPVSLVACTLIFTVAAVGLLPPVSAAGVTDGPGVAQVVDANQSGADNGSGQSSDSLVYDPGDGVVYNVLQSGQDGAAGSGFHWYTVQGGDGLNKIANKFGLSPNTVYWANKSRLPNLNSIAVGLRLLIPPVDGVVIVTTSSDTLSSLGQKYKVAAQSIAIANALSSPDLKAGQILVIPVAAPAIPQSKSGGGTSVYTGGNLRWPIVGYFTISQYFSSSHPAIDLAAPTGTPVVAAAAGQVIYAGWKRSGGGVGGGIVVWINHNGKLYTTYNHLSAEIVRVGQNVVAGQRIGSVGMTGNATGPHLHFEVWVCYPWNDGTTSCARNPLRYLP